MQQSTTANRLNFTKMHGLGNDFIVIDLYSNLNQHLQPTIQTLLQDANCLQQLCHRQFGIGADQILVIEASMQADFKYRIFNADGSEVEHCGNGARCFGRYVYDKGLTQKTCISVEVKRGLSHIYIEDNLVKVAMSIPSTKPEDLPFQVNHQVATYAYPMVSQYCLSNINNCPEFGLISMGNPHAVIQQHDLQQAHDLQSIAKALQASANFSQSVNVGLMQCIDKQSIDLRVYERGSGETLACGTGACAAVAHAMLMGYLNFGKVEVNTKGGKLWIEWQNDQDMLYLIGPTAYVFDGNIALASN